MEEAVELQLDDAKNGFFYDALGHLGGTFYAVGEGDGYFTELEAETPGGELHLDLEGIANKPDFVQLNGFQHFSAVTDKPCGWVFNPHPGDEANIKRSTIGQDFSVKRPIDGIASFDVAGTNHHICVFFKRLQEPHQVIWVVREIAIHLENMIVALFYTVFKSFDIGCS